MYYCEAQLVGFDAQAPFYLLLARVALPYSMYDKLSGDFQCLSIKRELKVSG